MPWRAVLSPYAIWLSEIILQQTRVVQGYAYYERILKAFPTLQDLAAASQEEVLSLWQGLGYYTRARNLHACAKKVVALYGGEFPKRYKELLNLPGIGPYTAAAVASIAFEERVAVVDGNVYRFLARLFGLSDDISQSTGQKKFQNIAHQLLPQKDIGTHNQAMMEFGALVCTPKNPKCSTCPFQDVCLAYRTDMQDTLPFKGQEIKIRKRFFHYLVLHTKEGVYMQQRRGKDIWKGLYEFHLLEEDKRKNFQKLENPLIKKIRSTHILRPRNILRYRHRLTHQQLELSFFCIEVNEDLVSHLSKKDFYELHFFTWDKLVKLPLPIAIRRAYTHFFETPKLL